MKILVTGGSGNLGKTLVTLLNNTGIINKLIPGIQPKYVSFDLSKPDYQLNDKIQFVAGSITDLNALDKVMKEHRIDSVVHLAGWHGVHEDKKTKNEADFEQLNVEGTANVLKAAAQNKVRNFVFMSSTSIHNENTLYGKAKKKNEELIDREYAHRMKVISLRAGAFIPPDDKHVYSSFAEWAKWFWRSGIHISDVAKIVLASLNTLEHQQENGHQVLYATRPHDFDFSDDELKEWEEQGPDTTFAKRHPDFYELANFYGINTSRPPKYFDTKPLIACLGFKPEYSLTQLFNELSVMRQETLQAAKSNVNSSQTVHGFFPSQSTQLVKPSIRSISDNIRTEFLSAHTHYAETQLLTEIEHVVIYLNGYLSLWKKNEQGMLYEADTQITPALGDSYNLIKSISHCSVWLNLILQSIIEGKGKTQSHQTDVLKIKVHLEELKKLNTMSTRDLSAIEMIQKYVDITAQATDWEEIAKIQIDFLRDTKSINDLYASLATELQLKGLNTIVANWGISDWSTSRILIVSAHGPRKGLIEKQYFLDLYSKHGIRDPQKICSQIVTVQMIPEHLSTVSKQTLIDFLRNNEINRYTATTMLGDSRAMNRDVLSPYAPEVLQNLCPWKSGGN